jgi:hypothetical protein
MKKTYFGREAASQNWEVSVIIAETETRTRIIPLDKGYKHGINHSPDGFAWGYNGSGPAQLGFAILCEEFGPTIAKAHYMKFKASVLARLDMEKDFKLSFKEPVAEGLRAGHIDHLLMQHVEVEQ